jgi:plastocyanin
MPTMLMRAATALALLATLAACGGSGGDASDTAGAPAATGDSPAAAAQPAATGDTIVVQMITDEKGNYFEPKEIDAKAGDLVRFTLTSGVHNVHFLPDSNAVKSGLPVASDMLQLPGQTYDLVVALEPGTYYFQCDPHALLGMMGHLRVAGR